MKKLDVACAALILIGAFAWGVVGLFNVNLIGTFVENVWAERCVYALIGVAAIYKVVYWKSICSRWKA
jgi:uncharacterized membrane protein YuzA (DUF378 family)